jgi:hypothetical protein
MKILQILNLILQYHLTTICGDKPEINLSVVVPRGKAMPWSLQLTDKALEMGEDKIKEILKGQATVNILMTISQSGSCSKYDFGALGAKVRYVMNVSAFIGPGKYLYTCISCLLASHLLQMYSLL